jgi:hypothetical protein
MAMQTIDSVVLQARIRFNQLTKPQAIHMALKAGISENAIEGCSVTVLKNILTRRYLLGAIVGVWKRFPADVIRYIGAFFDCDLLRIDRIRRQLRVQWAQQTQRICNIDAWFRHFDANHIPIDQSFRDMQTQRRTRLLAKQTLNPWALNSDLIAEKYKELEVCEKIKSSRLAKEFHVSVELSWAQKRIDRDKNAHVQRCRVLQANRMLAKNLAEQEMLHGMYDLTLEAEEMERRLADQAVREFEAKEAAKVEKKKQWLAAKAQEKKASAAAVRQTKEEARLAQRALDRKGAQKKEVKW